MGRQAARQGLALAVALWLWSLAAQPTILSLVAAYVAATLLLGLLGAQRLIERVPARAGAALLVLALLSGGLAVARTAGALYEGEDLIGFGARLVESSRLQALPAIAPQLVTGDRPQTFFVHAQPGARVSVAFGPRAKRLRAVELGEGLFRVDYDPRRDGAPVPGEGALEVILDVNGSEARRELRAVTPLAHPRWLRSAPDRSRALAVSEETDELALVSSAGLQRLPVGDGPSDALFIDATHVAIAHARDTSLWIVDLAQPERVQRVALGAQQTRLALAPSGRLLAVARAGAAPEIAIVSLPELRVLQRVPLGAAPDWLEFGPGDDSLVVATRTDAALHRLQRTDAGFRELDALPLGRPAVALARSDDGTRLYAAVTDYRPDGSSHLGNHFVQDQILTLELPSFRVRSALLTARRSERQARAGDLDRGLSPLGLAPAADGSLLVAFAGSDEIWRVPADGAEPALIDLAGSELHAPHGVAELADGTLVVSSPSAGALGLLARGASAPRLLRLAPSDGELLARDRDALERRLGERGFYEGTRSGISCQSCHLHGDSDERAHNLGDHQLLPTLSVRGLLGLGPYLRDGTYARLSDLDHVAQRLYRGYLRRAPGRPQTLEAYVASLPRRDPAPRAAGALLERQRRGLRAFVRAGCDGCHAFPAFTNLGQQLARTLFPRRAAELPVDERFDTPSLLSIASSAPYLSDGRARTLEAVLVEHNASNHHGDTAGLASAERADLIAFLESL